jgi:hypothetical protein
MWSANFASVDVPSLGFSWKSDPLTTSHADFAVIGEEVNGGYYATQRAVARRSANPV